MSLRGIPSQGQTGRAATRGITARALRRIRSIMCGSAGRWQVTHQCEHQPVEQSDPAQQAPGQIKLGVCDLLVHVLAYKINVLADKLKVVLRRDPAGDAGMNRKRDRLGLFLWKARIAQTLDFRDGIECRVGHSRSLAGSFCNISPFRIPRQSAPAFLALLWFAAPALSQTLGIDCDAPRRNADGRLILGDDGTYQALCEADRATALNYARVVYQTRDLVRSALNGLPPPLWGDLVAHLRDSDAINDWTYSDTSVLNALKALSAAAPASTDAGDLTPTTRVSQTAQYWTSGLLTDKTSYPREWHVLVKARACGVDADGRITRHAAVLIWLDPQAIRDRWSPEMVQRTVRTWMGQRHGFNARLDRVPDIVTGSGHGSGYLKDWQSRTRNVSGDAAVRACFFSGANAIPDGALALLIPLRRKIDEGWETETCTDPDEVGARNMMWARHNGVYIVPDQAIGADGSPHALRGEALLDPPVATGADALRLTHSTCRAPRTLDAVRAEKCDAIINDTPVKGTHVRHYRFREVQSDPDDPFRIDMVPVGRDPDNHGNPLGVIAPAGAPHPVWKTVTLFCEGALPESDAPDIPAPVVVPPDDPDWKVPDCRAAHGGRFNAGTRRGVRQTITYPAGWVVRDVEVRSIEDDCFDPVLMEGVEVRITACAAIAAGESGEVVEGRDFQWWNRDWAVPGRHQGGRRGDRRLDQAIAAYDADPAQAGLDRYDRVMLARDWHVDRFTCKAPVQVTDTQTRPGTCPAGQTGTVIERRSLSWYNRDPGAVPPHVITDREVDQAAADYEADPAQAGLDWFRTVTATSWRETLNTCRTPPPENPEETDRQPTCGWTCSQRGGRERRTSDGEYCEGPKLPLCRSGGGDGGGSERPEYQGSIDTDGDGITDRDGSSGGHGWSPDRPGSEASSGNSYEGDQNSGEND